MTYPKIYIVTAELDVTICPSLYIFKEVHYVSVKHGVDVEPSVTSVIPWVIL